MSMPAGTCQSDSTCICTTGFSVNPTTGRCKVNRDARDAAPPFEAGLDTGVDAPGICTVGQDQTCNDDPVSWYEGFCQANGTCTCRAATVLNRDTGRCGYPRSPKDAGADAQAVCTVGFDETCNEDPAASLYEGTCQAGGTCTCNPRYLYNPSTGRCRLAFLPAVEPGPEYTPACSYSNHDTCSEDPEASASARGTCQPDGTCICDAPYMLNPGTGRCMPVPCVLDADQSCNDDPSALNIGGQCGGDGKCLCNNGFVLNPNTGKCAKVAGAICSGTYRACGCACCQEGQPDPVCYYPAAGDSLDSIIAMDQSIAKGPACGSPGCTSGRQYLCCEAAAAEPPADAKYQATYITALGEPDRISLSKAGQDGSCAEVTIVNTPKSGAGDYRVATQAGWSFDARVRAGRCAYLDVCFWPFGALGEMTLTRLGSSCSINAHMTVFSEGLCGIPFDTVRIDADNVPITGGPGGVYCQ